MTFRPNGAARALVGACLVDAVKLISKIILFPLEDEKTALAGARLLIHSMRNMAHMVVAGER